MPSLNFPPNQNNIPDLDILASQAENFLNDHPDISIFRVRQLLELLVHEYAKQKEVKLAWDASLKNNIDFLRENKSITHNQKIQWQALRDNVNKACHYNETTTNMDTWKRQAPDFLLLPHCSQNGGIQAY